MLLDELVQQQCEFYERRAPEWRAWIDGYMGDLTSAVRSLLAQTPELVGADVLEIAAGTGYLTRLVSETAGHVWALDASPGMLAELQAGGLSNVTTMCHDVFDWSPSRQYGAVVCANWLSHVPYGLWQAHWRMLEQSLSPGGVVAAIDATLDEIPHLGGHPWWQTRLEDGHREPVTTRQLDDGTSAVVVKHFWEPEDLLAQIAPLGWCGEGVRVSPDRGVIFYRLRRA